jgi:hypothetical protein
LIFPSFFEMVRRLQKSGRVFTIILRTMGIESRRFLETVREVFEGRHPNFRDLEPIAINDSIGSITRSGDTIRLEIDGGVYEGDQAIYEKLTRLEGKLQVESQRVK